MHGEILRMLRFDRLIIVIFICYYSKIYATIIGSNLSVSRNNFVTFPEDDEMAPNEIRGFALMDGGFALENSATDCLFTGLFPIRSHMSLNGGTLNLQEDLIIENIMTLSNLGDIRSVNDTRTIMLPSTLKTLGNSTDSNTYVFENIETHLKSDITLDA